MSNIPKKVLFPIIQVLFKQVIEIEIAKSELILEKETCRLN
jgi:hypothetical protein